MAKSCRGIYPKYVFTYVGEKIGRINNSAWDKARVRTAMKIFVDSGKTIPAELLRKGQRGILITDELKKFMESVMLGLANVRVHDLKHTFGRRLRAASVPLETRKVLLEHKNSDITSHYSALEIDKLLETANRLCRKASTNPNLAETS